MATPLEPIQILVACLAVGAGALVQGSIGFGMALLASPILVMVSHQLVPGPLIVCGLVLSLLTAARDWREADSGALLWLVPGVAIGSGAGAALLLLAPPDLLSALLGLLVLIAVAASAVGPEVSQTRRNLTLAGLAAGFLSTTASIPGPPLALIYQRNAGGQLRGTLAAIFLLTGAISLVNLTMIGRLARPELELAATLAPAALIGFGLSWFTADRLPPARLRTVVLALSALAGIAAVLRGMT